MSILHRFPSIVVCLSVIVVTQGCYRSSGNTNGDSVTTATTVSYPTSASILDMEWSLIELNGQPVGNGAGGKRATLMLASQDRRASGFAGCNQMTGTYAMSGTELRFSAMILTRMACSEGMDLETRYTAALEATRGYRVMDKQLDLMSGDTVLARLTKP